MAAPILAWHTTTLAKEADLAPLNMKSFSELTKSALRITVITAYWDQRFLSSLFDAIPTSQRAGTSVEVIVNGFSGRRAVEDAEALSSLAKLWSKRGLKQLTFSTVSTWQLFHTKLLVFERKGGVKILVGSANATEAAFTENEELMLMIQASSVPEELERYLDAVRKVAKPIEETPPYEARTLSSFFRGGDIYYRPAIVTSFRFDLRLPASLRVALTSMKVPIAGMTARAGQSYNPFAQVGLSKDDELELVEALEVEDADDPEEDRGSAGRVSLRSYGVQTCYGWWVPSAYNKHLEKMLTPAREKRDAALRRLEQLLDQSGALIRKQAGNRFRQLEKFASSEGFQLLESSERRFERFDTFLVRARTRLADRRWRDRAEKPYERVDVPEIWNDPVSSRVFIDSFFEYLEFVAATKRIPLVWSALLDRVDALKRALSSEEIRTTLATHLRKEGWRDHDWVRYEPSRGILVQPVTNPCPKKHWQHDAYQAVLDEGPTSLKQLRQIVQRDFEMVGNTKDERDSGFMTEWVAWLIKDGVIQLEH